MPTEDVSDLREVVDAINKLCETMKSSYDTDHEDGSDVLVQEVESDLVTPAEVVVRTVETNVAEAWSEPRMDVETAPSEPTAEMYYSATADGDETAETSLADKWSDSFVEETDPVERTVARSEPICETYYTASSEVGRKTETQPAERWSEPITEAEAAGPYEPSSEMYYTASSEVSLLSETDLIEKVHNDDSDKDDRNIIAGHVAAMRERFESMTRANTPCPDLGRSLSPSLDMFRNTTPSPDFLDKS